MYIQKSLRIFTKLFKAHSVLFSKKNFPALQFFDIMRYYKHDEWPLILGGMTCTQR